MAHNLKKCVFHEKIHTFSSLHPIDLKFGLVVDIINIYHQKNFRIFGVKIELLELIENLPFKKKINFSYV